MKRAYLALAILIVARAVGAQQAGSSGELVATPNRPTVTNTADTTQRGVLEIEDGIAAGGTLQELQGLLKFGATRDLELRLGNNTFQHDASVHSTGVGDTTLGAKYRFLHQTARLPVISLAYTAKLPTAGDDLGTGQVDHQLSFLASKDFGQSRFDFNFNANWFGRAAGGFDHDFMPTLSWSYQLPGRARKFQFEAELFGETSPNAAQGGSVSHLYAIAYTPRPRLVLDIGGQFGLMGPVPTATFVAGFTYSIVDFYRMAHRHSERGNQ